MFTKKEKRMIEVSYFTVIRETDKFIEFQSNNTKHQWIILKNSFDSEKPVTIYHKHSKRIKHYHKHNETWNVNRAILIIKGHDDYVLKYAYH